MRRSTFSVLLLASTGLLGFGLAQADTTSFSNPALAALQAGIKASVTKGMVGLESVIALGGNAGLTTAFRAAFFMSPYDFKGVGDGVADDTQAVQACVNSGGCYLPPMVTGKFWKVTGEIFPPANARVYGSGPTSTIKLVLPVGAPAIPVIEVKSTSPNVRLENFAVDGGFNPGGATAALAAPTIYGANIIAGSAVVLGGSQSVARGLIVNNAWDNGISIVAMDGDTSHQPSLVDVGGISCSKNGYGSQGGACVDNASGSASTVHDSQDYGSYTSFINDIGAGAHGVLHNLISRYAVTLSFYNGSADTNLSDLYSEFSGGMAFWLDAAQQNKTDDQGRTTSFARVNVSNLYAYLPARQGVFIKGGKYSITNARVTGAFFGASGSTAGHYAYEVNTQTSLYDIVCTNCSDDGSNNVQYGWGETTANGAVVLATLNGAQGFNGTGGGVMPGAGTGPVNSTGPATFGSTLSVLGSATFGAPTNSFISNSPNATTLQIGNTSTNGHTFNLFAGGTNSAAGLFAVYDVTTGRTPFAISNVNLQLPATQFLGWTNDNSYGSGGTFDTAFSRTAAGIVKLNGGNLPTLQASVQPPAYTVAGLPACSSTTQDRTLVVSDATAPSYRGALTGGGSVRTPVYCDGSSWTAH